MKIALLVNPLAGLGGAVGLKGSDGSDLQAVAIAREGRARGAARVAAFLECLTVAQDDNADAFLQPSAQPITWVAWGGLMGADYLQQLGFDFEQLGAPRAPSSAQDTIDATATFVEYGVDLIIFVGGDGTARDVLSAASSTTSFLGVPAGVKMHSGVFAISPRAAARVVADLANGRLIDRVLREVRDYIEPESGAATARDAVIRTRAYGELWVPEVNDLLQQTKVGGKETEALAINEISSYVTECWLDDRQTAVILGPGSTCMEIKRGLGIPATLLGVDVRLPDHSYITDATASQLLAVTQELSAHVVLSFTRQQAFLLGRGNQQLTPAVLAKLRWPDDYTVVSSRQKLLALQQRPLLVDSDDPALDAKICGLVDVVTGYDERSLYRVASPI